MAATNDAELFRQNPRNWTNFVGDFLVSKSCIELLLHHVFVRERTEGGVSEETKSRRTNGVRCTRSADDGHRTQ